MNADLETYFQDHLAGASTAIEVIGLLLKHSREPILTNLLSALMVEVQEDKSALEGLVTTMGMSPSTLKDSAGWIGARFVTFKARAGKSPFGAFEGLEFLSMGIQGKLHLWKALQRSPACENAMNRPDFGTFIERAVAQHRKVEELRLALAAVVL